MGLLYSLPNMLSSHQQDWLRANLPDWMPTKTINLGLDLQGGSHLLLEVDVSSVIKERADDLVQSMRTSLRENSIRYGGIASIEGGVRVRLSNAGDIDRVKSLMRDLNNQLFIDVEEGNVIEGRLSDQAIEDIRDQTISQSIEIVRRRVDETGTREPVIQRQGDNRIVVQLPGLEDPQRIKDLLGRTAKLTFHLVSDQERSLSTKVLPYAEQPGQTLPVKRRSIITGDMLTNAQPTFQQGMPVVSFRLNGTGTRRFCEVTKDHTGDPFAIVLDNKIISAPRINEPICGGSAVITGQFSLQEANDLALLLRAGALPAPLTVLEERTVGPSLGADSVEAGKIASLVGLGLVLVFMLLAYGRFGFFADIALVFNVAIIFAVLSGLQATLTLPGIAGIVLTVGMAVDANVLIFERIREELNAGRSIISAIDSGYSRAMTTIIDSNLTTLIAAILLYSFGTGPIKGFAVTLGIGIVTSFFSAIMVTRLMVVKWLRYRKPVEAPI